MKFSLFSAVALLGVTAAAAATGQPVDGSQNKVRRQQQRPAVNVPTMADANGNVIPYNRNGVVQNNQKRKAKRDALAKAQAK